MKKNENKKKASMGKSIYKVGLVMMIVFGFAFAMVGPYPHIEKTDDGKTWHIIWEGSLADAMEEATPATADASCILMIYLVNHSADPANAYDAGAGANDTYTLQDWCNASNLGFANADDSDVELAHTVAFDIVVKVRGNTTVAYREDESAFWDSDLLVEITSADLSIGGDTDMTGVVCSNSTSYGYIYVNFYDDNSGSGYTLSKDQTAEITSIKFSAYY